MPDTGAPWNIPYVDPTDLVRDYPQASEDLADAIADGLDAASAGSAGIGSNLVQTVKTDVFSTSSTSFTDVTGMGVTITPSSDDSLVLILVDVAVGMLEDDATIQLDLTDASNVSVIAPDSPSSRTVALNNQFNLRAGGSNAVNRINAQILVAPATDLAVTYKIRMRVTSRTGFVNRGGVDTNNSAQVRTVSTLTAIEVAA